MDSTLAVQLVDDCIRSTAQTMLMNTIERVASLSPDSDAARGLIDDLAGSVRRLLAMRDLLVAALEGHSP
jgi:hypothetical protein